MERTLIIIKPDGVQRQLIGRLIARFEEKGLKIVGLKLVKVTRSQAEDLYRIHRKKAFYQGLLKFITSSPSVMMVIEAIDAISICRKLAGATFGPTAEPGTIRGDFSASLSYNLIHASDTPETAKEEIAIFFKKNGLIPYKLHNIKWIYHPDEEEETEG